MIKEKREEQGQNKVREVGERREACRQGWPSGPRRQFKVLFSSEAWVRTPPLAFLCRKGERGTEEEVKHEKEAKQKKRSNKKEG